MIKTSTQLQQQLFLKPQKDDTAWLVDITNLPAQQKPLRRDYKAFIGIRATVPRDSEEYKKHHGLVVTPIRINQLCLYRADAYELASLESRASRPLDVCLSFLQRELDKCETRSWREMFLTQPPVQHAIIEIEDLDAPRVHPLQMRFIEAGLKPLGSTTKITKEGGIRVGDVVSEMANVDYDGKNMACVIYMHGVVEASAEDEKVMGQRTREWRQSLSASKDQ